MNVTNQNQSLVKNELGHYFIGLTICVAINRKSAALMRYSQKKECSFFPLLFWESFNCYNFGTTGPIQMGFSAKCTSPNQIENWKCHLCDFWLISLYHITDVLYSRYSLYLWRSMISQGKISTICVCVLICTYCILTLWGRILIPDICQIIIIATV